MNISTAGSRMSRLSLLAFAVLLVIVTGYAGTEGNDHLSYPELGITVSSLIHPSIGYWWDHIGVRFTGMYLNSDHHEFHFNLAYGIYESGKVQHSINLLTSWIAASDPGADYKYGATGIAYSINCRGIFFEIGVARPWRDDIGNLANNTVVPCGYFGYIYRFRSK